MPSDGRQFSVVQECGNVCEIEGARAFSAYFFSCNAIGLMLNFPSVGRAADHSALTFPALP